MLGVPVDECLGVELSEVREDLVDESRDERAGRVDPGDELRDDLQPRVDLDGADAVVQRLVHLAEVAVVEEQRQQPQRVLLGGRWQPSKKISGLSFALENHIEVFQIGMKHQIFY